MSPTTPPTTPIAPWLRAWIGVEIGFGVMAIGAIGLSPADTDTNFAWPISPVVMAAMLGAFYISSALLFVLAVLARRWEMVRVMVLPIALFTSAQLLATFLHWEKFSVGTTPFIVWFASYLLPPPIFIAAYVWHQRRALLRTSDQPLPRPLRQVLLVLGGVVMAGSAWTFAFPGWVLDRFAWALTPLTTRSLCGWLLSFGAMMLSAALEDDRDRARLVGPTFVLILPVVLAEISRSSDEIDWSSALFLTLLAVFAVMGGCGLLLLRGDWRQTLGRGDAAGS